MSPQGVREPTNRSQGDYMAMLIQLSTYDDMQFAEQASLMEPDFDDSDFEIMDMASHWQQRESVEA